MSLYENPLPVSSPFAAIGDDVYAKPDPRVITPWDADHVLGAPDVGVARWLLDNTMLDRAKSYSVWMNVWSAAFTVDAGTNTITSAGHGIIVATRIYCRGAGLPAEIIPGKPYYCFNPTANTLQLKESSDLSGAVLDFGAAGAGAMSLTATSKRSAADQHIGDIPAVEALLTAEGEIGDTLATIVAEVALVKAKTDTLGTLRSLLRW